MRFISTFYIKMEEFSVLAGGLKNPDETRGRHFKGRNRRDTGQEEGGTHVFYSSVRLGNSTEPIPGRN